MKNLLFLMLSIVCFNLEANHFQSSISVTPTNNTKEFLIEMEIRKVLDSTSVPQLIASPKIICVQGEPAEFKIESEDKANLLSIQVMIPENIQNGVQASVMMKEQGQVILSFENVIKLKNS